MGNEELLDAFASYLDAALNMDPGAQIIQIKTQIKQMKEIPGITQDALLLCHENVQQAYGLRLRPDAFRDPERTRQKALAVVKSYAASHTLQGMTRKDYCSMYPESSFERAASRVFLGFLQILQVTR